MIYEEGGKNIQWNKDSLFNKLFDIAFSNIFFGYVSLDKGNKLKINKWDYTELKNFCTAKQTINKTKRQSTACEKIFANDISNKD